MPTLMLDAAFRPTTFGTQPPGAYSIVVASAALEALLDYSDCDLGRETGGFLIGTWSESAASPSVFVRHFLPAAATESTIASLRFTHDTWAALTREVERRFPDERVVGWHHTHPNLGVFLSAHDRFIHRHFFSHPWQIALVVDPVRHELGFFQWSQGKIVDCGFVCVP